MQAMESAQVIPQGYGVHVVQRLIPIVALAQQLYSNPSSQTIEHFIFVNSHIQNGVAKPGQVVLISPAETMACTAAEQAFLIYAGQIDEKLKELSFAEQELLAKRYDLLRNVAKYNGLMLGMANNSWNAQVKNVEAILKEIDQAYVQTYNSQGNLRNQRFFTRRQQLFSKLDGALSRFGQPDLGGNLVSGDIRRNLGLSSKSIVYQWDKLGGPAKSIPGFAENYKTTANMAKNLKRLGYVGIMLTGVEAYANIRKACLVGDEQQCTKSTYVETGKGIGAVAGGIGGGFIASYGVCTLVFSLPSGGTSVFWCSIVAGGLGGYAGGKFREKKWKVYC
ncbi:hypothetical protein [Bowmanella pacifica]|nr:hypothetical protein [Bowmanella pacifica]